MSDYQRFLNEVGLSEENIQAAKAACDNWLPSESKAVRFRQSAIHGTGMFAEAQFNAGDAVADAKIGGLWTQAGRFANHAQHANMEARNNDGGFSFVANTLILPGEELTVNYRSVRAAIQPTIKHENE